MEFGSIKGRDIPHLVEPKSYDKVFTLQEALELEKQQGFPQTEGFRTRKIPELKFLERHMYARDIWWLADPDTLGAYYSEDEVEIMRQNWENKTEEEKQHILQEQEKKRNTHTEELKNQRRDKQGRLTMRNEVTLIIPVDGVNYPLIITPTKELCGGDEIVKIKCEGAGLDQDYAREDLPWLIDDIGEMIADHQEQMKKSK